MITVASQSLVFLDGLKNRKRNPVKPATLAVWTSYAKKITALVGEVPIESFQNGNMKALITRLCEEELNPRTIHGIVETAKRIIASCVDNNGNERFPRRWNVEFLDAPPARQSTFAPSATREAVEQAVQIPKYGVLFALLGATGLRIGEALALRIGDDGQSSCWDQENSWINVRQSVWRGHLQEPKTASALRCVDLCQEMNRALISWIGAGNRKAGEFLFASRADTPLSHAVVYRSGLSKTKTQGAHAFRRFRAVRLAEFPECPVGLVKFWLGHATHDLTQHYARGITKNLALRREWTERIGLGFVMPANLLGLNGQDCK